jgi:sterol 14-demethylase
MFAYLQIKTIWAVLLDELDFERDDLPAINYQTMIHTPLNPLVRYRRLKPSP